MKKGPAFRIEGNKAVHLVYGKDSSVEGIETVPSFSICDGNSLAIATTTDPVIMLVTPDKLSIGRYTDEELLNKKAYEDFKSLVKDPEQCEVHIYAGTVFASRPIKEGELDALRSIGLLEASKISQGKTYLDLPVLSLLQMRLLGIDMKNIYLDRIDPRNENSLFVEGGTNIVQILRKA